MTEYSSTDPTERIQALFNNYDGPEYKQESLGFDYPEASGFKSIDVEEGEAKVIGVALTKAPTENVAGKKMVPVTVPAGVDTDSFRRVLAGAFQSYLEHGRVDEQSTKQMCGLGIQVIRRVFQTEEFAYALACRGVDVKGLNYLTPDQDAALMILTDISSKKSFAARLREAGIPFATYLAWMKNPIFAKRMNSLSESITSQSDIALLTIGQKVADGDVNAARLQLEINERYNPSKQAKLDLMVMVTRIQEILSARLGDQPQVLEAISSDLRALATEAQISTLQQQVVEIRKELR